MVFQGLSAVGRGCHLVALTALALLVGCATPTDYVVVPEESEPGPQRAEPTRNSGADTYTVKPGDSLYLISFATGADWQQIARLNGITPPPRHSLRPWWSDRESGGSCRFWYCWQHSCCYGAAAACRCSCPMQSPARLPPSSRAAVRGHR